jgi:hypothetical protein
MTINEKRVVKISLLGLFIGDEVSILRFSGRITSVAKKVRILCIPKAIYEQWLRTLSIGNSKG